MKGQLRLSDVFILNAFMTDTEYRQSIDIIIYLCSCAINKIEIDKNKLANINIDHLYQSARKHMLSSMIGQILRCAGMSSDDFNKAIALSERKIIILDDEYKKVASEFESSQIWYMPIKGYILKDFYPGFAMREMADVDVLIDSYRAEDAKTIMENLGYQVKSFGEKNDDDYIKKPVSNFELHRHLFYELEEKELFDYYKDVKERLLVKDENNQYGYHFRPEDFYIYLIAHEYKHFNMGGTGLRSLVDTYIFLKRFKLDMKYVSEELNKLEIGDYEENNRSLANKLFTGTPLSDDEQKMFDYIISSGTFGTFEHRVDNKVKQAGGKNIYLLKRFLGPIKNDDPYSISYRKRFSTFYKYPILLPFLPIYRLFDAIKNRPNNIKKEIKAIRKAGTKKKDENF